MKKLVVAGAIVASLFTALPSAAQQQTPSQRAQAQTAPNPQAAEPITLGWWRLYGWFCE